jgi:hypothetical protein
MRVFHDPGAAWEGSQRLRLARSQLERCLMSRPADLNGKASHQALGANGVRSALPLKFRIYVHRTRGVTHAACTRLMKSLTSPVRP